jgi:hypothetical protein
VKILSNADGRDWLARNCQIEEGSSLNKFFGHSVTYRIPADSGRKTAIARALREFVGNASEGLLWITGWGVWSSSENMSLFDGYRKSLGEHRSLREAPFHLFTGSNSVELECLLDLTLYFFWDAILIHGSHTSAFRISHDEYIEIHTRDNATLSSGTDVLESAGLQRVPGL